MMQGTLRSDSKVVEGTDNPTEMTLHVSDVLSTQLMGPMTAVRQQCRNEAVTKESLQTFLVTNNSFSVPQVSLSRGNQKPSICRSTISRKWLSTG